MKERTFIAPGRVEIGGNHTDHQHGLVLTAAVDLHIKCTASPNNENKVNIKSVGHGAWSVDLSRLEEPAEKTESSAELVRGIAAWFKANGHAVGGFNAEITSKIPVGSGLSSSAAFEVLIGNVFKGLYGAKVTPLDIALAGKHAENNYFGKPSGLMDQMASSFGGLNVIDFSVPDNPTVIPLKVSFTDYALCVVDTGTSHADLTPKYAAIPHEMMIVAGHFGKQYLHEVKPEEFYESIGKLRQKGLGDRALLRALHFFEENKRVKKQAIALQNGKIKDFLRLVNASGRSSLAYLQNVYSPSDTYRQGLTMALAMSEHLLADKGAWRVHGGGFAGTILAIVPVKLKDAYEEQMCKVFQSGACHFLNICDTGGGEVRDKRTRSQ